CPRRPRRLRPSPTHRHAVISRFLGTTRCRRHRWSSDSTVSRPPNWTRCTRTRPRIVSGARSSARSNSSPDKLENARAAAADDIATIAEWARALRAELREMRGGALWEVREAQPEPLDTALHELLARADALVVVGTIEDAVIGYGIVVIEVLRDGTALGVIRELFVEADARAVGVGEAIAERLVAFCREQQCAGIDAFALPGHRDAKNFFERSGFTARELTMHRRL